MWRIDRNSHEQTHAHPPLSYLAPRRVPAPLFPASAPLVEDQGPAVLRSVGWLGFARLRYAWRRFGLNSFASLRPTALGNISLRAFSLAPIDFKSSPKSSPIDFSEASSTFGITLLALIRTTPWLLSLWTLLIFASLR